MDKIVRIFHSFEESEKADQEYYLSLSPEERLEILFELIERYQSNEAQQRLERVYRVVKLEKS